MDESDWIKGIIFSVLASVIGAGSKLAIRKSWLMEADRRTAHVHAAEHHHHHHHHEGQRQRQQQHDLELHADDDHHDEPVDIEVVTPIRARARTWQQSSSQPTTRIARPRRAGTAPQAGFYAAVHPEPEQQQSSQQSASSPTSVTEEENIEIINVDENINNHHHHEHRKRKNSDFTPQSEQTAGDSPTEQGVATTVESLPTGDVDQPHHHQHHHHEHDSDHDNNIGHIYDHHGQHHPHHRAIYCQQYCTIPIALRFSGMIGMTFLNPAFCLLAMNYATPSILAPFSGLTLVWVIVFSQPLIGEKPNLSQIIASSFIVCGEVIVAVFGDHSNDQGTTIHDVEESYRYIPFICYFIGLFIWMILLGFWMQPNILRRAPKLTRFAWGVSGGSVTGAAQNFIKDSLVVVKATKGGITHWPWYIPIFVLAAIIFSFGGLLLLTATMKRYDATYSAAMFVGSFVISTSIMSAIHYHTFENLDDVIDYIMYPVGLVILMLGVSILVHATREYHAHTSDAETTLSSSAAGNGHHHHDAHNSDTWSDDDEEDDGIVHNSDERTRNTEQETTLAEDDDMELARTVAITDTNSCFF